MDLLVALWTPKLAQLVHQWAPGHLVDEIVQQVWLDALSGINSLNDPANFPSWIRRIAYRCSVTAMQRHRLQHPSISPDVPARVLAPSWMPVLLALLGPTHRRVFSLHYVEGYSVDEISVLLNIPPGTIKSRLHNSRLLLRRQLSQQPEFHDEST